MMNIRQELLLMTDLNQYEEGLNECNEGRSDKYISDNCCCTHVAASSPNDEMFGEYEDNGDNSRNKDFPQEQYIQDDPCDISSTDVCKSPKVKFLCKLENGAVAYVLDNGSFYMHTSNCAFMKNDSCSDRLYVWDGNMTPKKYTNVQDLPFYYYNAYNFLDQLRDWYATRHPEEYSEFHEEHHLKHLHIPIGVA